MITIDTIREEFGTGKSAAEISKIYKVSTSTISRKLKKYGLNAFLLKSKLNINFFENIDTPEKAYILGFLYADGCVSGGSLHLCLAEIDKEILVKIRDIIAPGNKLHLEERKTKYPKRQNVFRLQLHNKKLVDDLKKHGVVERKTKQLKFPNTNQLPQKFIVDFIHGYFDGDGCIFNATSGQGQKYYAIDIVGKKTFLKEIQKQLIIVGLKELNLNKVTGQDYSFDFFSLKTCKRNNIKLLYNLFYETPRNLYLKRKHNIFLKFLKWYDAKQ